MQNKIRRKWVTHKSPGNFAGVTWQPGWERVWGQMDTCVCTAEPLCWTPEATTALLIGYTSKQNKQVKTYSNNEEHPKPNNLRKHLFHRRKANGITQKTAQPQVDHQRNANASHFPLLFSSILHSTLIRCCQCSITRFTLTSELNVAFLFNYSCFIIFCQLFFFFARKINAFS